MADLETTPPIELSEELLQSIPWLDNLVKNFDEKALAKDSLKMFMLYTDPFANSPWWAYILQPFHRKIIEVLEKVEKGEIKRLMINVPPQHGKSSLSSVWYAWWSLWRNQYQNIALWSYSAELSEGFSRKTRDLIKSDPFKAIFWDILSPDSQSITEWNTKVGWSYRAVWVWGSLTGKAVDKMIIDDPHKDLEEAKSDTMRNKVWDWYTSVVLSRAHINTAIVIIMTRRHEDDLCGRLLEREKDDWVVLNIPVFNEDWTVIRPVKHPKELIDKKRQTVWEAQFQALYMWDPINEWWGAFKKEYFQYYEKWDIIENRRFAKDMQVVTFVDPAISQKQTADSTALVTVWLDKYNNNIYILDIRRGKMLPKEIIDNIFDIVHIRNPQKVGIETNQFQKMLELEIRKEMNTRGKYFQLEWLPSTMNKEAKIISALQGRYSNASILHLKNWMNVNELEAQLLKFPNWKHDDIVDATAMATMLLDSFRLYHKKASVVTMDYSKYL